MRASRAVLIFTLISILPAAGFLVAAEASQPEKDAPVFLDARVVYLQRISAREAMNHVRRTHYIRNAAIIASRDALILSDEAGKLDQAVMLLKREGYVARVAIPHGSLDIEALANESAAAQRVFDVASGQMENVILVLRAIYRVKVRPPDQRYTLTVQAPLPILDSSEALLRDLGLIGSAASGK